MEKELELFLQEKFGKSIQDASNEEIYAALLGITKKRMEGMKRNEGSRIIFPQSSSSASCFPTT